MLIKKKKPKQNLRWLYYCFRNNLIFFIYSNYMEPDPDLTQILSILPCMKVGPTGPFVGPIGPTEEIE